MTLQDVLNKYGNASVQYDNALAGNINETRTKQVPVEIACSLQGDCSPITGKCDCHASFVGPACQYHCMRSKPHGNAVCGGVSRGNCTWNGTLALQGSWCHPHFPSCQDQRSKYFGVRCECREDTRGPDCSIDCPKDPMGRVCSNNGTCNLYGVCECKHMVEGSYCQYGMLNDTYTLRHTPAQLTPRRFAGQTTVDWYWQGWDDEVERDVPYWESLGIQFGGVGAPKQKEVTNIDPITKVPFKEVVTQQFTFQDIWFWNQTGLNSFDKYTAHPKQGAPKWIFGQHQCYSKKLGKRIIGNCNEELRKFYVPSKRSGHTMITLGDHKGVIMFGGYSTICADYCEDLWHLNTETFIWSFLNMSDTPRPRFVTDKEYVARYGLNAKPIPENQSPAPSRRWLHSMAAINGSSIVLFGGYWSYNKKFHFMNDLWVYTLKFRETPEACIKFGDNIGRWTKLNNSNWGKEPGTAVPPGRRGHVSAFINGKLYIYGGQIYEGGSELESLMSGREGAASSRIRGDLWEGNELQNQWRMIHDNPSRYDTSKPVNRYLMAYTPFKVPSVLCLTSCFVS